MEHQCDNALHIDSVNNDDSFNIFKPKILIPFDAFYEDYIQYKGYVNDIINSLIPKEDALHRTEKENTMEHRKNIELLENQIKDLKRENQILKEILTPKSETNNDNNSNGSKTF